MARKKNIFKNDVGVLLLDIITINLSYYLALIFRAGISDIGIFVNRTYSLPFYLNAYIKFAPVYTIICILVFSFFHLYGAVWKLAGVNDLRRILLAWGITTLIQIIGSIFCLRVLGFERSRMPITYYIIGSTFQLFFTTMIRFLHRIISSEKKRGVKKAGTALVVGAGELGRLTVQVLQDGENFNVACIVDTENEHVGLLLNGVPVYGIETLAALLDKNDINCIFLAEPNLKQQDKNRIRSLCKMKKICLRERVIDNTDKNDNKLISESQFIPIASAEGEWVDSYEKQFGEAPSFF